MTQVELIWDLKAELGEGPVWSARDRGVWFVDIKGRKLHRYSVDDGARASWDSPDQIGFALPAEDGSLICGVRGGLYRFDPATGAFSLLEAVETDRPQNRLNDGYVAPDGSLWFGSMDDSERLKTGALYRWTPDSGAVLKADGYGVTNGPVLSPDGNTLYHHDTLQKTIETFDHTAGEISNRRVFAVMDEGYCDGPSMDSAGILHVGLFGGWGVARYAPDGRKLGKIEFPVSAITKAAFGDDDLKTLYCTTAWLHQTPDQRESQPLAGGLFRVRVDTAGQPQSLIRL
ncbi:SMP-30/gluconolactonase/LRE family protein [uncultured Maricaulis sp.]|uniref:SMP-30/gluconolactonase/LRE family protein n=1 Tax=uncultured Maricaulis sp. TaxID=174710 RepID=UPI0025FBBB62|nr:SMP-30/gluconolactonase/LRE family protein [uncultured Maricaulis sp.]